MIYTKKLNRVPVSVKYTKEEKQINLGVSPGEYNVYDSHDYDYMETNTQVGDLYESALIKVAKDKKVLDIGTGQYLDWAIESLFQGAESAVAIEGIKNTFELAKKELTKFYSSNPQFKDKITLINSWSYQYFTEKLFDVCVSEIIGSIGGAEGVEAALADASKRFLNKEGKMVPHSCKTLAAAVCARELLQGEIAFDKDYIYYVEKIFQEVGYPFDLRLILNFCNEEDLNSTSDVIENLEFFKLKTEFAPEIKDFDLTVTKDSNIDGLLLWINLLIDEDKAPLDSFKQSTWDHVYIPIFDTPIPVKQGDKINVICEKTLSDDNIHPNYYFKVRIGEHFGEFNSTHHDKIFQSKSIYKELFNV